MKSLNNYEFCNGINNINKQESEKQELEGQLLKINYNNLIKKQTKLK